MLLAFLSFMMNYGSICNTLYYNLDSLCLFVGYRGLNALCLTNRIRICRNLQGTAEHDGMCRVPLTLRPCHRRTPLQGGGIVGPRLLTNLALPRCPKPHTRVRHGLLNVRSALDLFHANPFKLQHSKLV